MPNFVTTPNNALSVRKRPLIRNRDSSYYGIFPRRKDDIFVRQKSLHMCPTSTLYMTYGKLWSDVYRTVGRLSNVWWVLAQADTDYMHCKWLTVLICTGVLTPLPVSSTAPRAWKGNT